MLMLLSNTRTIWAIYGALLALIALLFFAGLASLPLDTYAGNYFRDNADACGRPVVSSLYFRLDTPIITHD